MDFINKLKIVLFQPTSFFAHLKKEQGVKTAFLYFLVVSFIGIFFAFLISPFYTPFITSLANLLGNKVAVPTFSQRVVASFFNFLFGLGLSFVGAALLHLWILIFGGRAPYSKTYQLSVYSSTPTFLLGWIPVLGLFSVIYNLVLLIIGTQQIHGLSKKKVLLMYLIPFALLLVFLLLLMGLVLYINFILPVF